MEDAGLEFRATKRSVHDNKLDDWPGFDSANSDAGPIRGYFVGERVARPQQLHQVVGT